MLSLKKNFLFIRIPKTGGSSIKSALSEYSNDIEDFQVKNTKLHSLETHSTLMDYRKVIDNKTFKKLYKFSCVRNPWDRLISLYFYRMGRRGIYDWSRNNFIDMFKNSGMSNRNCLDYLTTRGGRTLSKILGKDYRWKRILGIKPEVNFIIRFENLQSDFDRVCDSIGVPRVILPHKNKSLHKNYKDYYDDELIKLIEEKFREDIQCFGYTFNKS